MYSFNVYVDLIFQDNNTYMYKITFLYNTVEKPHKMRCGPHNITNANLNSYTRKDCYYFRTYIRQMYTTNPRNVQNIETFKLNVLFVPRTMHTANFKRCPIFILI